MEEARMAVLKMRDRGAGDKDKLKEFAKMQEELARLQSMGKVYEESADRLRVAEGELDKMMQLYKQEQLLRKKYHNTIQDMKGAVRVYCRYRPMLASEANDAVVLQKKDEFSVQLTRERNGVKEARTFNFDSVFDLRSTQQEVFTDCADIVQSALDGYNVTIFAYGQTGSGKTYTMYGTSKEPGLAPRTMSQVWERIAQERGKVTFVVKVYMMELWKDDLIDLLHSRSKEKVHQPLIIKKDAKGMVYVQNATEVAVNSKVEMMEAMAEGLQQRHTSETKMNRESSRSHLIFSVVLTGVDESTGRVSTGKMTLCDLAGSERVKKSEAEGEQLKEAIAINKSLSALGDVIEALTTNAKAVPYRNHKLTQLMSDSLGGNAKTLMFVNLSPTAWNAQETLSSLVYATRAKQVTNKASRQEESEEIARLKQVISQLSKQLQQQQDLDATGSRVRGAGHE